MNIPMRDRVGFIHGKYSLTSLGASHITLNWPPQLERGLTSIDGLLQQNPL